MKLSTSTNLVCERPDGTVYPLEKTLAMCKEAGFKRFDINFWDWSLPHSPFLTDKWEEWIHGVAEETKKLDLEFGQCHGYTFDFLSDKLTPLEYEYHQNLVHRSLECCNILGSNLCVTHPSTDFSHIAIKEGSKQKNVDYFKGLMEVLGPYNMELAIENMCDYSIAPKRKYCSNVEELVDLVETIDDKSVGICFDVEHADIMEQNQKDSILYMGKHLKALHISDTHSKTDTDLMHVLPMFGGINYVEIMEGLREINYTGDFSFEAHNYANRLPDELIPTALKLAYEIGDYLMNL